MCGQAGIHRRNGKRIPEVNRLADELLLAIENRGTDATGFVALMENGKVQLEKRTHRASRFIQKRGAIRADAKTILLHTRYATVGTADDPRNAHPQAAGTIAAVHNGTIYNADEIFKAFDLPRRSQVDSEVIPALINYAGWDQAEAAIDMFEGGCATAVINTDTPGEVILARTRSYPMIYMETADLVVWASTRQAIERAWRMTFGKAPKGTFHEVPEWTVVRINGKISAKTVRVTPAPPPTPKRKAITSGTTISTRHSMSKRQAKRAKGGAKAKSRKRRTGITPEQLQLATASAPQRPKTAAEIFDYSDSLAEQAIRDLIEEGFSREDAEDMIWLDAWREDADEDAWDLSPAELRRMLR